MKKPAYSASAASDYPRIQTDSYSAAPEVLSYAVTFGGTSLRQPRIHSASEAIQAALASSSMRAVHTSRTISCSSEIRSPSQSSSWVVMR